MQEIQQRTKHFIEEVETALQEKNMRNLKGELHSLLDELYYLQEYITKAGTPEEQQQLDACTEAIISIEQDYYKHIANLEQDHVKGSEEYFFNAFKELFQPKLHVIKELLTK